MSANGALKAFMAKCEIGKLSGLETGLSPERAPVAYQMAPAPAVQWIVGTLLLLIDLGEECKDQFLGNEA